MYFKHILKYANLFAFGFCSTMGLLMLRGHHPLVALMDFGFALLNLFVFLSYRRLLKRIRNEKNRAV